jgi:hypothetical protein
MDRTPTTTSNLNTGVPPTDLPDEDLIRELASVHSTRTDTLRFGSHDSLVNSNQRMAELEAEYLRRYPQREVDPARLREGSRAGANEVGREEVWEEPSERAW